MFINIFYYNFFRYLIRLKCLYFFLLLPSIVGFCQGTNEDIKTSAMRWYFYTKFGTNTSITYQTYRLKTDKIIATPKGFQKVISIEKKDADINPMVDFIMPDFSIQFFGGIYLGSKYKILPLVTGIEYVPSSVRSLYRSNLLDEQGYFYLINELNIIHSVSVPIFLDTRIYNERIVTVYGGMRIHFNFMMYQIQAVSWEDTKKIRRVIFNENEFEKFGISYAAGITLLNFICIEISYHPKPFLNLSFSDIYGNKPYGHINKGYINIGASIMIGRLTVK